MLITRTALIYIYIYISRVWLLKQVVANRASLHISIVYTTPIQLENFKQG